MTEPRPFEDAAFRIGDWLVEPSLGRISRHDEEHLVELKTMAVLQHLAARPGAVVAGDELVEQVWNGRPMGDNPVYKCIAQLRKALGDNASRPEYIATVPKRGYRLLAPVTPAVSGTGPADAPPAFRRLRAGLTWAVVAVLCAVLATGAWLYQAGSRHGAPSDVPALAVLPFAGGDNGAGGLSGEGFARAISDQFQGNDGIRVIAQGSVSTVRDADLEPADAARRLQASHLLQGRIAAAHDGTTVEVNLTDDTGVLVWSRQYRRGTGAVSTSLLDDIVQDVSGKLGVEHDLAMNPSCGGTRDIEACQLFLMAHEHVRRRDEGYKRVATDLMQQAIARDPGYAAAHADMGSFYLLPGADLPWPEAKELARNAIDRALELDPDLAEAHAALGLELMTHEQGPCPPTCYRVDGYAAAQASLRRAVELKPGLAQAHNWLAIAHYGLGELAAARERLVIAQSYDPLNPAINYNIALHTIFAGDIDGARRHVQDFRRRHPRPPTYLRAMLAHIENYAGDFQESLRQGQALSDEFGPAHTVDIVAGAYYNLGMFEHVTQLLDRVPDPGIADEAYVTARSRVLHARGALDALADYTAEINDAARAEYGEPDRWPRWLARLRGLNLAILGHHAEAAGILERLYALPDLRFDFQAVTEELDGMQYLAWSLHAVGRDAQAEAVLAAAETVMLDLEDQGYSGFPDLTYARARNHALQGRRALAVATLRQAVSQGWRRYWHALPDPRWAALINEADFREILAEVRDQIKTQRDRVSAEWALSGG